MNNTMRGRLRVAPDAPLRLRTAMNGKGTAMQRRRVLTSIAAASWVGFGRAQAQTQTCNGVQVAEDAIRCPDGSIPTYGFGSADGADPLDADPTKLQPQPYAGTVFGVWHTNRSGLAYSSPSDVPGASAMNLAPGMAPGDLTIDPNGAFVWNTTRPMYGRWIKGKTVPVVLLDSNENKRWSLNIVGPRLEILDGKSLFTGRR